jgi:hypothetical protein
MHTMIPDPLAMIADPIWRAPARVRHMGERKPEDAPGWSWLVDGFVRVWRDAERQAGDAYGAWCRSPGASSYAVYRAEQDRADTAQDALADWASRVAARRTRGRGGRADRDQRHVST